MNILEEIRKSDKKPKELNAFIAKLIIKDRPSEEDFSNVLASSNDAERGTLIEALEYASQTNPEVAKPYIPTVIDCLEDKSPRVKWEASRVIGNISKIFSEETGRAIPNLLINTTDKGTVVRWSTAFALGEIAKNNSKLRASLVNEINKIVKKEQNNGVKNVYLKALKVIDKQNE